MKNLIIVRGLPGSGKSTFAELIAPHSNVAADDYFIDDQGRYEFDYKELDAAHEWCHRQVAVMMELHAPIIAVHNTFVRLKYIQPYIDLAEQFDYRYTVLTAEGEHGSVHNVPPVAIARMIIKWEAFNNPWKDAIKGVLI